MLTGFVNIAPDFIQAAQRFGLPMEIQKNEALAELQQAVAQ